MFSIKILWKFNGIFVTSEYQGIAKTKWIGSDITNEVPGSRFPWRHWVNNNTQNQNTFVKTLEPSWEATAPRQT